MADCPKCGLASLGAVDFCPNPQCRTYLGWASAAVTPEIATGGAASEAHSTATLPLHTDGAQPIQQPMRPATVAVAPEDGLPVGPAQKRGVRVAMEPAELTVDPGSEITTTVTVRNLGTRVEEFQLAPQGPGAAFASVTPDAVSVYPDLEQRAVVRFTPRRGPESPAGVTTFEVVARSVVHSDVRDVARGRLTVTPFEDLRAVLTPALSRGRKPARHQVNLTNGGNTPVNSQVTFTDQDGVLTFEPREGSASLRPGATQELPVLVNGPRRWFGRTERLPFAAVVTPAGPQPPITLNGTRQQTAVFPWWIPTAAFAILALAIGVYALLPGAKVPEITPAMDRVAAEKALTDAKYVPDVQTQPDEIVLPGQAIGTDPKGGTPLDHGQHVKLMISAGKCPGCPIQVDVPNVVGLPKDEAKALLERRNFNVRPVSRPDDAPVDQVITSDPAAGTPLALGSWVVLTVSSGPKPGPVPPVVPVPGGPPPSAAPQPVALPNLTARSVEDATKALTDLGLKAKTVPVHSNAAPDGQVLSTNPAAPAKVDPGSDVTLTVAQNTAPADLIATADQAAWKSETGNITFPGKAGDSASFVLVGRLLSDSTVQVLETHPTATGFVTGVYKLAAPAVPGDHLRARIGLQGADATGKVTFQVKASGQVIKKVTVSAGQFTDLDADLSTAKGATSIEITVLGDASSTKGSPVWQDLRLEPQIG
ncbi:MAG: PASTA domain-containing protein [Pseudonocardiaceae bacterium]